MEKVWLEALSNLQKVLTQHTFNTWIQPLKFMEMRKDSILLEVPNEFFKEMINENYLSMMEEAISAIHKSKLQVELMVSRETPADKNQDADDVAIAEEKTQDMPAVSDNTKGSEFTPNMNPKYTFETFVCGASNQFAHAAAQAVANNPATNYNPLFIYGGVGLGKTHLLHAIGNFVYQNNRNARICYYSSEKFMNELINCLRYNKMDSFRSKFRSMALSSQKFI